MPRQYAKAIYVATLRYREEQCVAMHERLLVSARHDVVLLTRGVQLATSSANERII